MAEIDCRTRSAGNALEMALRLKLGSTANALEHQRKHLPTEKDDDVVHVDVYTLVRVVSEVKR